MNSPLQLHEVHLRGLGGPAVCGTPRTCASATMAVASAPFQSARHPPLQSAKADFAISSGEFIRSWRGLGGPAVCGIPRTCASATVSADSAPFESPCTHRYSPRRRTLRFSSGEFIRSWRGRHDPAIRSATHIIHPDVAP
jgi:hypothetical protein